MIIYFDTETTSLYAGEICQLSYILDSGDFYKQKNFYFAVSEIEPSSQKIHGLSIDLLHFLSGGKHFADYLSEIHPDFAHADLIVAHNFNFDYTFMQAEFNRQNKLFEYKEHLCTAKYFKKLLKLPSSQSKLYRTPSLCEVMSYLDIPKDTVLNNIDNSIMHASIPELNFHNAIFDTAALRLCHKKAFGCKKI